MDLEDFVFGLEIWHWELDLPINTSWSNQGRVQGLYLIGSHDDFNLSMGVKAVKLIEKLEHSSLDFLLPS